VTCDLRPISSKPPRGAARDGRIDRNGTVLHRFIYSTTFVFSSMFAPPRIPTLVALDMSISLQAHPPFTMTGLVNCRTWRLVVLSLDLPSTWTTVAQAQGRYWRYAWPPLCQEDNQDGSPPFWQPTWIKISVLVCAAGLYFVSSEGSPTTNNN